MKNGAAPLRRCVGCREMKDKKQLIRVACGSNVFIIDNTGKEQGRGAYVCKDAACVARAIKAKGLERSFKRAVPAGIYEELKLMTMV